MISLRSLVVAGTCALLGPVANSQLVPMQTDGGRVVLTFLEGALEQAGLELVDVQLTADTLGPGEELLVGDLLGFAIHDDSDLIALRNEDGNFQPYGIVGGGVRVDGGFVLSAPATGGSVDFHGFEIHPTVVRSDGPGGEPDPDYFYLSTAADPLHGEFQLCYVKVFIASAPGYEPPAGGGAEHEQGPPMLFIKAFDLIVTPGLAARLGRPDLAGRILGTGKVEAGLAEYGGDWSLPPGQNVRTPYLPAGGGAEGTCCNPYLDVKLGLLSGIQQVGHVGTFPTGRTGMSMSTTSCNVGNVNVPWQAAMQENHPGIAMALFRELNGRFEQVGVSWMKHGFFALSNSQCTTCQNPSGGTFLGVGCSDTYGTSNNGDPFWLGPRDEWNPFTGAWTCLGSYFDGTPVDCVRSETGSGNGSVNHRLEAFDADLGNAGATYYYEAFYLVRNDGDLHNNVGSRLCTMTWTGTSWSFTTPSAGNTLVEGPAIERWGELRTQAGYDPGDGEVILAVQTTNLGGGQWRYEYALYNWHMNRRPGAFSVPVQGPVTNVTFHDIDDQASNDWVAVTSGNQITWTFPDVFVGGHKEAGPLRFGTLYNFGFTSAIPPANRAAAVDLYDSGAGGARFAVATRGPAVLTMTASDLAPAPGQDIDLVVQGGAQTGAIVVFDVNDILLDPPLIFAGLPFVGGTASLPVTLPLDTGGLTFTLVALDYNPGNLQVLAVSNFNDLAVQ